MSKRHEVNTFELMEWLGDNERALVLYASSTKEPKAFSYLSDCRRASASRAKGKSNEGG
jgi:hypothetical protein